MLFSKAGDRGDVSKLSTELLILISRFEFDGSFTTLGGGLEVVTTGGTGGKRGEILVAQGDGDPGESPRKPIAARRDRIRSTAF